MTNDNSIRTAAGEMRSSAYVDERLRAATDDNQKEPRPRSSRPQKLVPLLLLLLIGVVPLWLLSEHRSSVAEPASEAQQAAAAWAAAGSNTRRAEAVEITTRLDNGGDDENDDLSPPSPPFHSAATPVVTTRHPPYSAQGDCRRNYDRKGEGDGFARCGGSCCRSHAGITCYYKADQGLCDRFLQDGGAGGGGGGGKADEDDDSSNNDGGGGGGADPFAGATKGAQPLPEPEVKAATTATLAAAASSNAAAASALALGAESLAQLVPMTRLPQNGGKRQARMLKYPTGFNLTWTRNAPPPRSDGWQPSEGQRKKLPDKDLKEQYYASCAIVGSSGTLRRSGYGRFIDAHELVMRFNGAPAGGGYANDVGSRTTLAVLADVATTECMDGKSRQPSLVIDKGHMDGHLLQEAAPGWRSVRGCDFYPESSPPATLFFLPRRGGVRRLLDYSIEHPSTPVLIRSDQLGEEVDSQVDAYKDDSSHPTSGFNGIILALHICESIDLYGFGSPRDKFYSPPRKEKEGSQHLYRTEMRWMLGLERRFPGRVRVWP